MRIRDISTENRPRERLRLSGASAFVDVKIKGKKYSDGWRVEENESTKPLD